MGSCSSVPRPREQPTAIFLHQEQWSDMQSPPLGLDVAVHKSPSMCGCREVSCSKKSPWDVHPMTGHTSWSCTQPPAATPSEDGAQPLCALVLALLDGLLPTSPECNHSFNRGGIKLLSCSPAEAPLHHSCLQPETGAARASLPSWAEALQLIRLSLPHHGRQWDQSVPNPCYRSGVSNEVDPACAGRL